MLEIGKIKSTGTSLQINQDDRYQHVYAIGQTGTGKSTFLKHLFLQDVHAGFGTAYFDFHGFDAPWLLDHIPPERIDDVIYVNPLDPAALVGFNPLDGVRKDQDEQVATEIVANFKHIFHDSWGGRMDDIFVNAVRPLLHLPYQQKTPLLGAVRMLNDPAYRKHVLRYCKERAVRDFWYKEFGQWKGTEQTANVNSTLNKIRVLQANPILRRVFGQPCSTINLRHAVQAGKIIIFDINKLLIGEKNASIMGALFLSRLIYEVTTRPKPVIDGVPVSSALVPFMLHIDEFHSITSSVTAEAFSGARKCRLGITCAHQYTRQLTASTPGKKVFDAIIGNAGTKVVFRIGGNDATELYRAMEATEPKHLSELPDYNFFTYLKQGKSMKRERAMTVVPTAPRYGYGSSIIRRIRADNSTPIDEIDAGYEAWADKIYGVVAEKPAALELPKKRSKTERKGQGEPSSRRVTPKAKPETRKGRGTRAGAFRPLGAVMLDRFGQV